MSEDSPVVGVAQKEEQRGSHEKKTSQEANGVVAVVAFSNCFYDEIAVDSRREVQQPIVCSRSAKSTGEGARETRCQVCAPPSRALSADSRAGQARVHTRGI